VCVYHDIIRQCRDYSNWFDSHVDGDLPPTSSESASTSLTLLRRFMQDKNVFHASAIVVKLEADSYDGEIQLRPYEDFFRHEWYDEDSEFLISSLAVTRLFYCRSLIEVGHRTRAAEQLSGSEGLVRGYTLRALEAFNPVSIFFTRCFSHRSTQKPTRSAGYSNTVNSPLEVQHSETTWWKAPSS
jgi:hypothetical protein